MNRDSVCTKCASYENKYLKRIDCIISRVLRHCDAMIMISRIGCTWFTPCLFKGYLHRTGVIIVVLHVYNLYQVLSCIEHRLIFFFRQYLWVRMWVIFLYWGVAFSFYLLLGLLARMSARDIVASVYITYTLPSSHLLV